MFVPLCSFVKRVRAFVWRGRVEARLRDELQLHTELVAADYLARGATPEDARRRARLAVGGADQVREEHRDALGFRAIDDLARDVRLAFRGLRRHPVFSLVAVLTLALGIGINASVFALMDALLWRPLPVGMPEQLADVFTSTRGGDPYGTSSYPDYLDLRAGNRAFSDLLGFSPMIAAQNLGDRSRLLAGEVVTGNYFELLGVRAHLGRMLVPSDDHPGADRVVVVSHRFWRRALDGDIAAIGRPIRLRGEPYVVVGVAPPSFNGMTPLLALDIWLPVAHVAQVKPGGMNEFVASPTGTSRLDRRGQRWLYIKGRLRPGGTAAGAAASLQVVMTQLGRSYPETNKDRRVSALHTNEVRLHPAINQMLRPVVAGFLLAVGLLLLVVCGNVASLILVRASARTTEFAIRQSLGAGPWRLVRLLLAESLALASLGAMGGLTIAWGVTRTIGAFSLPLSIPVAFTLGLDNRALWYTLCVGILAGLLTGFLPALRGTRPGLARDLRERGGGTGLPGRPGTVTLQGGLVVGQIALAMVMLVSAALLTRSVAASLRADLGFDARGLINIGTEPSQAGYDKERTRQFWERAVERVRTIPGVERVALASGLPFSINRDDTQVLIPGHHTSADQGITVPCASVSREYFATLGLAITAGRDFSTADRPGTPLVAIVNATMARRFWPEGSAVGKRLLLHNDGDAAVDIVGVVADHTNQAVGEPPQSRIFLALEQRSISYAVLAARTRGDGDSLLAEVRRALLAMEPKLVFVEDQTMEAQVAATLLPVKASAYLVGVTGVLGALLAACGLYGVIACSVARRTRELGIRLSIGSTPAAVLGLVMRQGMGLAAAGIGCGALFSVAAAALVARTVYGVSVTDPIAWGGAGAVVVAVAAAANIVPAWRASRLDPVVALRVE